MAVTNRLLVLLLFWAAGSVKAAVLPEERTDLIFHSYDGGGIVVDGPAVLVRKNFAEKVSFWGRYYEDVVTGASIDVEAEATSFIEERVEYSVGADYLYDKTTMNFGFTNSDSGDYISDSYSFGVSHDFFGDLTTVALSFGLSDEVVLSVRDENFEEEVATQSYTLAVSQILTKNIIVGLTAQTIASEGFLNNPYREVRYIDPDEPTQFREEREFYPTTRNTDAIAIRYNQYLPYRASIRGEYRIFADNWGVDSDTFRLDYIHPFDNWTLHLNARYYDQTAADFYSDLFAFSEATTFRARDKELSTYTTLSYGIGGSYEIPNSWLPILDKSSVSLFVDQVNYDYADFRDVTVDGFNAGDEPFYSFDALVFRLFFSFWY